MLTYRSKIQHFRQEKHYSCSAAALRCIFDADEKTIRKIVDTRYTGTNTQSLFLALKKQGITVHMIDIRENYKDLFWLPNLSCQFPVYLSCTFKSQGNLGRPSERHHAVIAANNMFYDPSEPHECPIDAFEHTFNKSLTINDMIIIDHELPDFRKNLSNLC